LLTSWQILLGRKTPTRRKKSCKFKEECIWRVPLQPYVVQTPRILISKFLEFSWAKKLCVDVVCWPANMSSNNTLAWKMNMKIPSVLYLLELWVGQKGYLTISNYKYFVVKFSKTCSFQKFKLKHFLENMSQVEQNKM
jgi:hypothetical protein